MQSPAATYRRPFPLDSGSAASPALLRRLVGLAVATAVGLALLVVAAPPALAQPANDELASATVVDTVPFSTTEDTSEATSDPTDPVGCFNTGSVWFSYTPPSDTTVVADTFGSSYDTVLSAWTGTPGALDLIACNDDFNGLQSQVTFPATAGTAIYFMVGVCCSNGGTGGGSLTFSVNQIASPGNDAFAAAGPIASLPFSSTVDLAAATTEAGEPAPSCTTLQNTVWYSFTPTTTRALSASLDQSIGGVGVYTGTSLSNLSQVGCGYGSTSALVQAQANTTYYFQVGSVCCGAGPVTFRVDVAPDPVAGFGFSPSEPSVFEPVQFFDQSYDPAGGTISTVGWSFGDGATATGCCPTHQYASDGDYTVRLTVTTTDGRTASTSQVVRVRTHDVAVVQVAVPNSAHVGQTIAVNVHLRNTRYAETVRVDLYKSAPGGFQQVGALTQFVPVRPPGGNTTRFAFTYTVSPADGTIRKVSFRAVATIVDHPDALPGDNELISPPVRIT